MSKNDLESIDLRFHKFSEVKKKISRYPGKSVVLYGTGNHTKLLLSFLGEEKRILGLVDGDSNKIGQFYLGYLIYNLNEIVDKISAVIISSETFEEIIYQRIKGLKKNNIDIIKIYNTRYDMQNIGVKARGKREFRLVHLCFTQNTNAGDTLLFPAVRELFQKKVGGIDFTLLNVHQPVTEDTIKMINQHDGLIIGGGGLFLVDTNPNKISGWQWPCPIELLEEIKVPIIVFGVGYNRFRNQEDFSEQFKKSIQKLVEKSTFFGLRNHGSVESIKQYLPEKYYSKLKFQPCPTTLLTEYYPRIPQMKNKKNRIVAINIAMDRPNMRFGVMENEIFETIGEIINDIRRKNWRPILYSHLSIDHEAANLLHIKKVEIEELNLDKKAPREVIKAYSEVSLAIGMRGHAQMIPFGLERPIYSLISHNKLQYFLEDIHHPEWGIDIQSNRLRDEINNFIDNYNADSLKSQIEYAKDMLWETTLANLEVIKSSLR